MTIDPASTKLPRILDPMDRISEILFGLIMALTFTLTFAVATADNMAVRTMLFAALGLQPRLGHHRWRRVLARCASTAKAAQSCAGAPSAMRRMPARPNGLSRMRCRRCSPRLPSLPTSKRCGRRCINCRSRHDPRLTKTDWLGALGIFLLSFLSTFPIVIPFLFIGDARLALRVSNAVAIAMLFLCGFFFGRYAGIQPVAMGVAMVAIGCALVGVAIALGG